MSVAAPLSAEVLSSLSLPELVEYRMRHDPMHTITLFPGKTANHRPSRITYLEFGRAVQRFAQIVALNPVLKRGEIVGLMADCDALLYITAIAGFAHGGITVFPMSSRNSGAAVNSMLRKVSAHQQVVTAAPLQSLLQEIGAELATGNYHLDVIELPSLDEIYPHLAEETEAHPFIAVQAATTETFRDGIVMYLHSSGSTGFPKPIPWTHAFIRSLANIDVAEQLRGMPPHTVMAVSGLPSFHIMGIIFYLLLPIMTGKPGAMFAPMYPHPPQVTSPTNVFTAIKAVGATTIVTVPSVLEELSHDPLAVNYLTTLTHVGYGGGPLAHPVGHKLARAGCNLWSVYGSTECGIVTSMPPLKFKIDPDDWAWVSFANHAHTSWARQEDGLAELRLLPCETHVLAVNNMPGPEGGYATNDLWMPHPDKPGHWKIVGRVDDIITLATGEKVTPGPTEGALFGHPSVRGAVVFGRERNHVGVLVEPIESHSFDPTNVIALAAFRDLIWATIEDANAVAPAYGRIYKDMIIVTSPGKPLPRAAKGTVNRKAAVVFYQPEINALYEYIERPVHRSVVPPWTPNAWTHVEVLRWLIELATSIRNGTVVKSDIDLFIQGFDSVSATFLRNRIIAGIYHMRVEVPEIGIAPSIGPNFIYSHPVLNEMAAVIVGTLRPEATDKDLDPVAAVQAMIQCYTQNMTTIRPSNIPRPSQDIVLLTGSTGGLGSQILVGLLADSKVAKVYALNRASARASSLERHRSTFKDRGLDFTLLQSPKLVFLEGEAWSEHLGLPSDQYEELRSSVTIIIHNAWQLNFNLSLSYFEPHIKGTRHLVDLALSTQHAEHVRFLLASTIAVSQRWPRQQGAFPEELQEDPRWCIGNGYGEGKYVAEQILVEARKHGLQTTSFRIGQIAGGYANGAWALTDWVPIMLASAVALGVLPNAAGLASWIPFDVVSQAILDVTLASGKPEKALNLVHPRPVSWSAIMGMGADVLAEEGITSSKLVLIPMEDWVKKLTGIGADTDADTLQHVPAIKLLNFFGVMARANLEIRSLNDPLVESGGFTRASTDKARAASPTLRDTAPLGPSDVQRWIRYWVKKGMLTRA